MKKLIFLLIMAVALVGIVPAHDAAYQPLGLSLEAAMSEIGVESYAVTPDTVPVVTFELPTGYLAVPETNEFIGQPQGYYLIKPIDTGQSMVNAKRDFWLRL
jgi:hypothetical protein